MITLPNECKLIQVYIVVTLLGDGNELPGYRLDQTYILRDVCVIYSPDRCRREKTSCICLSSFTIINGGTRQTVSYCFLFAVSSVIYSYNSQGETLQHYKKNKDGDGKDTTRNCAKRERGWVTYQKKVYIKENLKYQKDF